MSVAAGCAGAICGGEAGLFSGCCVDDGIMCCGGLIWSSDGVGKGAACDGASGLGDGGVGGTLLKTGRFEAVTPRRAERGGRDGRAKETPKRQTR